MAFCRSCLRRPHAAKPKMQISASPLMPSIKDSGKCPSICFDGERRLFFRRFFDHGLRHKQIEVVTFVVPPLSRCFLLSCHDELRATPCCQVAEDRCFDVDARIHFNLPIVNVGSLLLLTTKVTGHMAKRYKRWNNKTPQTKRISLENRKANAFRFILVHRFGTPGMAINLWGESPLYENETYLGLADLLPRPGRV